MSRIKTQDGHLFFQVFLTGPKLPSYLYPLGHAEARWKRKSQGRVSGRQGEVLVWVHFGCRNGMAPWCSSHFCFWWGGVSQPGTWEPSPDPTPPSAASNPPAGQVVLGSSPSPAHPVRHCCSSLPKTPLPHTRVLSKAASTAQSPQDSKQPRALSLLVPSAPPSVGPQFGPKKYPLSGFPINPAFFGAPLTSQSCPVTWSTPTPTASYPSQQAGMAASPVPLPHPSRQGGHHPWFLTAYPRVRIWQHSLSWNLARHCGCNRSSHPSLLLPAMTQ